MAGLFLHTSHSSFFLTQLEHPSSISASHLFTFYTILWGEAAGPRRAQAKSSGEEKTIPFVADDVFTEKKSLSPYFLLSLFVVFPCCLSTPAPPPPNTADCSESIKRWLLADESHGAGRCLAKHAHFASRTSTWSSPPRDFSKQLKSPTDALRRDIW